MMKNSDRKAFRLFSTLNADEKKQFIKTWEGTPGAKEILEIYLKSPESEIEQAFSDTDFNYRSFLVQQNEIINALEEFILLKEIEGDLFLKHLMKIKRLNRAFDKKLFEEFVRKTEKVFESQSKRGASYYQAMYDLTAEKQTYHIKNPAKRISLASELNYYNKIKRWMDIIYLGIMNKNLDKATNGKHEYEEIHSETLQRVRDSKEAESGIVKLLLLTYNLLANDGDIHELIYQLEKNHEKDEKTVISDLYVSTLNHLMQKAWNDPQRGTNEVLSSLLISGIQSKYLFTEGVMNLSVYISYIKSTCLIDKVDEAERNALIFAKFLGPDIKSHGLRYGNLFINYFKNEYEEVINESTIFSKNDLNSLQKVHLDFMIAESLYFLEDIDQVEKKLRNIGLWLDRNALRNPTRKAILKKRLYFFRLFMRAKGEKEIKELRNAFVKSDLPFNYRYFFNQVLSIDQ